MELKVCGMVYTIIESEYFENGDERNLLGMCDYLQQKIYLRQSLSEQKKKQVLIHELTHAILHEAGFDEQDEDLVNRFSIVLHQVITDNPSLFNA